MLAPITTGRKQMQTPARPGLQTTITWILLGSLLAGFVFAAVIADGYITPEPELHDSGIWVTRTDEQRLGRTNTEINALDTSIALGSDAFDVLQSGADIVVMQMAPARALIGIDPVTAQTIPGPEVSESTRLEIRAGTAALLDGTSGNLFITTADRVLSIDSESEDDEDVKATLTEPGFGDVAIDDLGNVHFVDLSSGAVTRFDAEGVQLSTTTLALDEPVEFPEVAAIGDRTVVLDTSRSLLYVDSRKPVDVAGAGSLPRLQESGEASDRALVVTDTAWWSVPLDGGEADAIEVEPAGQPARPVVVGGCGYGAWNGNGLVARTCAGDLQQRNFDAFTGGTLRWRVNRGRVLLNQLESGAQLLHGEGEPVFIDNWAEVLVDEPDDSDDADDREAEFTQQQQNRGENRPPVAENDVVGTRIGRPLVVRPLRNDSDPDGDILVISPLPDLGSSVARLSLVEDGKAILVEPDPGRTQPLRFEYEITDGHDHSARASIDVAIVPEDINTQPTAAAGEETTVVTGGTVTHNVVSAALDPEGDPISLLNARSEAGDVKYEPTGEIAFTATNAPGRAEVIYTLVDDRGAEQSGVLNVEVVAREVNEPAVARADHDSTLVGREVVLDLLANDTDANGDDLTVVRIDNLSNATHAWTPGTRQIRVTADRAMTANLRYQVTDGKQKEPTEGIIRVDIKEPASQFPPVAVRDDVLLDPGRPVFVPVLENDSDPDGEVLQITRVVVPTPSPITVQIVNRTLLRIETGRRLESVVEFDYLVSDGNNESSGRVVVSAAPLRTKNQPPIARPDEYTVRAGGVAILPVMGNDVDPDGDAITLVEPEEVSDGDAEREGRLFLSGDQLRYQAPTTPKSTIFLSSTVLDSAKNQASAQLLIHVIDATGERNSPPVAPTLVGRVLAGGTVTVDVPLSTMDPEGDAVQLVGIGEDAPTLGSVVSIGGDEIVYRADDTSAGTDQFSYRVRDQFGLESTGAVLVGVAAASKTNNDPVAEDDLVNVQPGTTVLIPALANDRDPDGDPIEYATEEGDDLLVEIGEIELLDNQISYTAPGSAEPGQKTSFSYVITDGRGGRSDAVVTVNFVRELPNRAPLPADDLVEPQEPGTLVRTAPLQANDRDLDDDDLQVIAVSLAGVEPNDDGSVTFEMPEASLQFTYAVSDGVVTRWAAVYVPVISNQPPVANLDRATVDTGNSVRIDVLRNDSDPEEAPLHLLEPIGARHGTVRLDGDAIVFTASEEGYLGDAGFLYRVADSLDPETQLVSIGTVQVVIEGTLNAPATFTDLTLEVPQLGERALDVSTGVSDPDEDAVHAFAGLQGSAQGVTGRLEGSVLTVAAGPDARPGTIVPFTFEVRDGDLTIPAQVTVTVISSDRPLAQPLPDVAETIQGQAIPIRVLDNDVNPIPELPLKIVGVSQPEGAEVTFDERIVTFSPDPERRDLGDLQFEYSITDGLEDSSREVTGLVTVTVIGRPDIPAAPTCLGGESEKVQIGWAPPSANGAEITEYRVRITRYPDGGGAPTVEVRSFQDGRTVREIESLVNGLDHTFEVAAINRAVVGEPEFSAPSPRCKPDQVPDRPEAPEVTFGDGELTITFQAPDVNGSRIDNLILRNTTTGDEEVFGPNETSHTWKGLDNGTSYRFTLTARNERGDSEPSPESTGDGVPAGVPLDVVAPTTEKGDLFLTVNWERPNENGDAIKRYRITVFREGVKDGEVTISDATRRSTKIDTDNGVEYRFTVEAENKAGWSDPSPRSIPAVSAGRPFPVDSVSATDGDTVATLSFSDPDDNGAEITRYEVSFNRGSWSALASDKVVRNLNNGTSYTFRVRAVNSEGAGDDGSASNAVIPYGRPDTPSISADVDEREITWSWGSVDGNGRSIVRYEYSLDGGSWTSNGTSRSFSESFDWSENHTLRVRAVNSGTDSSRTTGDSGSRSARTEDEPVWSLKTTTSTCPEKDFVAPSNYEGGDDPKCGRDGAGGFISPNTTYDYECKYTAGGGWRSHPHSTTVWIKRVGTTRYVYSAHLEGSTSGMPNC